MEKLEQIINQIIELPEIREELLNPNQSAQQKYKTELQLAASIEDLPKLKQLIESKPKDIKYKRVTIILDIGETITLSKIIPTTFKGRPEKTIEVNIMPIIETEKINLEST
jgi:hypothetical protein